MRITTLIAVLALGSLLGAGATLAGQNAGARARIYWQVGSGAGLADRNSTSDSVVQGVVTVRGVKIVRGADVQLTVEGADGLPLAWQAQPGGCGDSLAVFQPGGFGGAYPDLFNSGAPILNLIKAANGMYYAYRRNRCVTPDSTGTIWLSAAGAAGAERDSSLEYAVFAFRLDPRRVRPNCSGSPVPADSRGVCIYPNNHIPCTRTAPKLAIPISGALTAAFRAC
jgi:hypothetical protein